VRLLTCSSSGPLGRPGGNVAGSPPAAPGGLAPILSALLSETGGHWIYIAPPDSSPGLVSGSSQAGQRVSWQPLAIDPAVLDAQREAISIRTLLWTFHYLYDTSVEPSFGPGLATAWDAYRQVNQAFADALVAAYTDGDYDVVLVHDFHLMLAPSLFAAARPGRASRLAYFHHVPWCQPDYFGTLPEWMCRHILESLLSCDYVGFHCDRWGEAFLACCDRFLPGAQVTGRSASYKGHTTLVTTAPGPIDAAVLDELSQHPETERWRDVLRTRAGGRRIVGRVDRLDLWKNLVRGFAAFDDLLRRRPGIADDLWFCAIVTPPRLQTDRHRRYQELCNEAARRVNERHGGVQDVISMLYPRGTGSDRSRAVAVLSLAEAALVNPTFDGLNMVAKEAVVVNPGGQLLLSTNAGAYPQLSGLAVPLQPFDVVSTTDALEQVLDLGPRPTGDPAVTAVRNESATSWLDAILGGTTR
jgi:trehalose 6-phosphate synthase